MSLLFIGIGGILGAWVRYGLGRFIQEKAGGSFPWGTWTVNVTGAFLLGLLIVRTDASSWIWQFAATGFLGAYTTFSTFGYETLQLFLSKRVKAAWLYAAGTICTGILAAWLGMVVS